MRTRRGMLLKQIGYFFTGVIFLSSCVSSNRSELVSPKIIHGKIFDSYVLVPPLKRNEKRPLIFYLHGMGENTERALNRWREQELKEPVIVVAPDWQNPHEEKTSWSDFTDLLADLSRELPIDLNNCFIVGVSAGGLIARNIIDLDPQAWQGMVLMAYAPPKGWFEKWQERGKTPALFILAGEKDAQFKLEAFKSTMADLKLEDQIQFFLDPEASHEHRLAWNDRILNWIRLQK